MAVGDWLPATVASTISNSDNQGCDFTQSIQSVLLCTNRMGCLQL